MKRSLTVTLVLMGGSALSGCGATEVDTAVYKDVQQCIASGQFPTEKCETDFSEAVSTHMKTAPAYTRKADCEAEFGLGKCEMPPEAATGTSTQHSGGFFMPMMMGYMMGSMLSNNQRSTAPQGLYQQRGRSGFYNSNGARVSNGVGPVRFSSNSAAATTPKTRTTTMARGGFGARSSAISS